MYTKYKNSLFLIKLLIIYFDIQFLLNKLIRKKLYKFF